jgi:hypothetical protein
MFDTPDERLSELEHARRESRRAVEEAGGGEAEGFELAEQELIEHASHGDQHAARRIMLDASRAPDEGELLYGEADEEHKAD